MLVFTLAACYQEQPTKNCKGSIVGTIGCYEDENDKSDQSMYHEVYIIVTKKNDTILSFNLEVTDFIHEGYGEFAIPPYAIPYKFSYKILSPEDKRYIHFDAPFQDAMRQGFPTPASEIKQAIVTPCK